MKGNVCRWASEEIHPNTNNWHLLCTYCWMVTTLDDWWTSWSTYFCTVCLAQRVRTSTVCVGHKSCKVEATDTFLDSPLGLNTFCSSQRIFESSAQYERLRGLESLLSWLIIQLPTNKTLYSVYRKCKSSDKDCPSQIYPIDVPLAQTPDPSARTFYISRIYRNLEILPRWSCKIVIITLPVSWSSGWSHNRIINSIIFGKIRLYPDTPHTCPPVILWSLAWGVVRCNVQCLCASTTHGKTCKNMSSVLLVGRTWFCANRTYGCDVHFLNSDKNCPLPYVQFLRAYYMEGTIYFVASLHLNKQSAKIWRNPSFCTIWRVLIRM